MLIRRTLLFLQKQIDRKTSSSANVTERAVKLRTDSYAVRQCASNKHLMTILIELRKTCLKVGGRDSLWKNMLGLKVSFIMMLWKISLWLFGVFIKISKLHGDAPDRVLDFFNVTLRKNYNKWNKIFSSVKISARYKILPMMWIKNWVNYLDFDQKTPTFFAILLGVMACIPWEFFEKHNVDILMTYL